MGEQEVNYQKGTRSLIGHLCHAATVVRLEKIFLRMLFGLLHVAKLLHHHIRLTAGALADIMWWKCLLGRWSDSSFFVSVPITYHVFSGASGSWGCGAVVEGLGWFQVSWPHHWEEVEISMKELVPVVVAAAI